MIRETFYFSIREFVSGGTKLVSGAFVCSSDETSAWNSGRLYWIAASHVLKCIDIVFISQCFLSFTITLFIMLLSFKG